MRADRTTLLRRIGYGLSAFALTVPIQAVSAPSSGDDPPLQRSGLVSVPQVDGRGYIVNVLLTSQYNSNFQRNFRPGADDSDVFRVTPDIEAGIGMPFGRQQLFVGGSFGRDFFLGESSFNQTRVRLGGGLKLRAGRRCEGGVGAEFTSFQNLVGEVAEIVNNVQEQRSAGAEINCQGAVGLGFGGSVRWLDMQNSRENRQLFDFKSFTVAPRISYASPRLGVFSAGVSFQDIEYPQRQVLTLDGPVRDKLGIRALRLGFARNLGTRFNITAGVSSVRVTPKPDSVVLLLPGTVPGANGSVQVLVSDRAPFTASGYDGSLSMRLGDRALITASTLRSALPNANLGLLAAVTNTHGLDIDFALRRGIKAGLGGTLSTSRYIGGFASPDEPVRRFSDKISRVYGQIDYSPRRRMSIGLEVAHQKRTSNPTIFDFSNTSALLRLRYSMGRSS